MSHLMGAAVPDEPAELDGSFCWWDHDGEPLQPSPVRPATPYPGPAGPEPSSAGGAGGEGPLASAAPALRARQGTGGVAGSDQGLGLGSMLRQGPGGAQARGLQRARD